MQISQFYQKQSTAKTQREQERGTVYKLDIENCVWSRSLVQAPDITLCISCYLTYLSCEWEDPRTKNVENVLITPFFPHTFSDPIEVYGCQVEIMTITTFVGFFYTKPVLNREKFYHKLNVKDCWEEMANLNEGATVLKALGHDPFTNDTSLTLNYY